ncbi:hypothetical protein [Altererythrobacter fulvus]
MATAIAIGGALVAGFLAWKVFTGLIKIASFVMLFAVAGVLFWQGYI